MTSGSSQGLFVIVAVVIFGIFVVISYILFRDNLKMGLSSIFEDSIESSTSKLGNFKQYPDMRERTDKVSKISEGYHIKMNPQELEDRWFTDEFKKVVFLEHIRTEEVVVPWGYSLEIRMDILSKHDFVLNYDYNSSVKESDGRFKGNDEHNVDFKGQKHDTYFGTNIEKDRSKTVVLGYTNNRIERNTEKKDLYNWSNLLVLEYDNPELKELDFTVKNIRWKIYKK